MTNVDRILVLKININIPRAQNDGELYYCC